MSTQAIALQLRKQELVKDTIWNAAIDLFAAKSFEQVTVDEIAQAAGISRRTFFRYFASKNDLMAERVTLYGAALSTAIELCPASWSTRRVLAHVTMEVARLAALEPRTRQIIRIGESSTAAREALLTSLSFAEDRVAEAFAARPRKRAADPLISRLLATLTLSLVNVVVRVWGSSESGEIEATMKRALAALEHIVSVSPAVPHAQSGRPAR